jgi:hypothetical protein
LEKAGLPNASTSDRLLHIAREANETYSHIDSYIARLRRKEQINGKDKPEEIMLIKFRKQPWSVYFKWLGTEGAGREVVYVKGRNEDKIQTLLAAGDVPLMYRSCLPADDWPWRPIACWCAPPADISFTIQESARLSITSATSPRRTTGATSEPAP